MISLFKANLIEIITLIISLFALFISWKNRKNVLRENLYNRQVDKMSNIYTQLVDLEETLSMWSALRKYGDSDEEKEKLTKEFVAMMEQVDRDFSIATLVLPDSMVTDFTKVIDYYFFLNVKITTKKIPEIDSTEVSNLMYDLSNSIRDFIGLEKLSSMNQRVIRN